MLQLAATFHYDAPLRRVAEMFADERFVTARIRATGALSYQVDIVGTAAESFTVTTRRRMPVTDIPAQFRSLVGSTLEVRQVDAWEPPGTGERHGTVVFEITGTPVRLTGKMLLRESDGTTTAHLTGDLRANLPLFGAAVESAVADAVRLALATEAQVGQDWLADPAHG